MKKPTPAAAARLLQKDQDLRLAQALEKLKNDQPLTAAERRTLEAQQPAPATPAAAQPSFDSIAAAAAQLGIPKEVLQSAKRQGAPGFRGSRVYPSEVLPWLQEHAQTAAAHGDKETLELQILRIRLEREQFEFERDCRQAWIARDEIIVALETMAVAMQKLLRSRLENEYPATVASLRNPAQIRALGKQLVDAIYDEMAGLVRQWKL